MSKGLFLILLTIMTIGFGLPVIWIYCGMRTNSDYYENQCCPIVQKILSD